MLNLPPGTVGLGSIAEAVVTDDAAGVENNPVPYHRPGENVHSGIDDAVGADFAALAYGDIVIDARALSDSGVLPNGHEIPHGHPLAYFGAPGYAAAPAVASVGLLLVRNILQQVRKGRICVFYPYEGGSDFLLGLKIRINQQDRSLAGIYILFVFGVRVEAELAFLAVLYLSE